ncbi:MAG: hypothetical protein WCJ76_13515, partial [Comamonadaceae bacterium]
VGGSAVLVAVGVLVAVAVFVGGSAVGVFVDGSAVLVAVGVFVGGDATHTSITALAPTAAPI